MKKFRRSSGCSSISVSKPGNVPTFFPKTCTPAPSGFAKNTYFPQNEQPLSNASTLNFLTLDQPRPFVHWHSLGITDQFARHLGVYAKGEIGKFDYRLAINAPGRNPLGDGIDLGLKDSGLGYTGATNPDLNGDPTGNMIRAYASAINFDYGENYLSRWGGTGTNLYGQLGYFIQSAKLIPYVAYQNGRYEGLNQPIRALDIGANYYINGHNCKITLEYHHIQGDMRESMIPTDQEACHQLRLQLQVFL